MVINASKSSKCMNVPKLKAKNPIAQKITRINAIM